MPETTFVKAVGRALAEAMEADETVIVLGEDVAEGGPYTTTAGLADRFGRDRVINTPISEAAITGVAIGAAQSGLRPVLEIMFIDFITLALDNLVNQAAKAHLMSGGQLTVPMVLRTQGGAGQRGGAQHSQSLESWLTHVPGLKVVMPSGAADAAGLMASAIADPGPVVFVEHKGLYFRREDVPDEIEPIEIGKARIVREGSDVTIVALSRMVGEALAAAELLAEEGIEAEVIDPRTLVPLDLEAITESVQRTNRLVVAHEAVAHGGVGAEIAAQVQSAAFDYLDAPIERVGAPFAPIPLSPHLEDEWVPGREDIYAAAMATLGRTTPRRSAAHDGGGSTMRMDPWRRMRSVLAATVLAVAVAVSLGACGSDDDSSTSTSAAAPADTTASSGGGGSDTTASTDSGAVSPGNEDNIPSGESKCGAGNGQKASGAPIKVGAIVTKQPGTDFTDGTNMAAAFFKCVNDNGGINGRPVEMIAETEQTDPGQVASLGKKLIEDDKVVAIAGSFSLLECAVNHKYYESNGYYEIDAGIAPECWGTSNSAPVNMGPRYSSDGATNALIKQGVKKIVFDQSNVPGTGYIEAGPKAVTEAAGLPFESQKDNVPIQDANSVALKLVQAAGDGGGVVLNFTPPEALKILQAAQQQGLQDRVKWACSTPCNTDFLSDALGSEWENKLFVNAELNVTDADGPDTKLYNQVREQYGKDIPLGSFSQMGFLIAKILTDRMLTIDGDITPESVNKAIVETSDYKTDLLCKPWYYGKAPLHIPNNTDFTTTPKDGKMVLQEGCTPIPDSDPDIAKVRAIEKEQGIS
jgi:pyruvate/2-oxoglutarate/acetoin dehydrogenase E1 component/ABC-type branched-subunit amino acid transport system substrate-binding protein